MCIHWRIVSLSLLAMLVTSCGEPQFKAVEVSSGAPTRKVSEAQPKQTAAQPADKPDATPEVQWRVLRGLNVRTGAADAKLQQLDGSNIRIAGYMVPLSDDLESVTEFLLVPSAGLCVHKPPPPANQIVYVQMTGGTARVDWTSAVSVSGALQIDTADSPFGSAAFRLTATAVEK